jgi:hypothetical protein
LAPAANPTAGRAVEGAASVTLDIQVISESERRGRSLQPTLDASAICQEIAGNASAKP